MNDVEKTRWTPRPPPFTLEPSHQPYFKLHGSWNWRSADNEQMLIIGGNKIAAIRKHPLLIWYHDLFEAYLSEPDNRLMVIASGARAAAEDGRTEQPTQVHYTMIPAAPLFFNLNKTRANVDIFFWRK
jgi:hypothetical protein